MSPTMWRLHLAALLGVVLSVPTFLAAQSVPTRAITVAQTDAPRLRLTQVVRLGSLDGPHDSFGRVMAAVLDGRGRILVADDQNHQIAVFSPEGRFVGTAGRRGQGPGEFESPWTLATDKADSIFVWDMTHSRISVFAQDLKFARSFRVPPHWTVTSIDFLPNGKLLLAAYGPEETGGLHVLARTGTIEQTFGPAFDATGMRGFEASLLGGFATILDREIVYTTKSPYGIWFFDLTGRPLRHCVGRNDWTTSPASVLEVRGASTALHWKQYVHSSSIVNLGNGRLLNQVLDPAGDRTVMDVLTRDCRLLRRSVTASPMTILHASGTRLVAVRTLDYPEVIVYEQRLER